MTVKTVEFVLNLNGILKAEFPEGDPRDKLKLINTVIKRLKRKGDNFGIFYRRMTGPYRIVVVTDASSANKTSSFATEGIVIGLS